MRSNLMSYSFRYHDMKPCYIVFCIISYSFQTSLYGMPLTTHITIIFWRQTHDHAFVVIAMMGYRISNNKRNMCNITTYSGKIMLAYFTYILGLDIAVIYRFATSEIEQSSRIIIQSIEKSILFITRK